jgi:hypothetical protein
LALEQLLGYERRSIGKKLAYFQLNTKRLAS